MYALSLNNSVYFIHSTCIHVNYTLYMYALSLNNSVYFIQIQCIKKNYTVYPYGYIRCIRIV